MLTQGSPKIALIVYHSNLSQYPKQWIEDFKQSILNQTYKEFDIFEINYSGGEERIFDGSYIWYENLNNHAEAMNFIISNAFRFGFDYVLNTNIDDIFALDRIEKQLPYLLNGYDIVSSNFSLFDDRGIFHTHRFEGLDIKKELAKDHNIICHPVIAYSKNFWLGNRYNPDEIPFEDMKLWQRSIDKYKFIILPDVLLNHREHTNSVGRSK